MTTKSSIENETNETDDNQCRLPIQLVNHGLFSMSSHDHLLLFQLFGDVLGRRARHFDPRLGEEGA